jgi:hypothetical protein
MVLNAELEGGPRAESSTTMGQTREMLDVAYVRRRTNAAHVSDEDALAAFS